MKRRHFLGAAVAAGMSGVLPASVAKAEAAAPNGDARPVPETLGGMGLKALREDYRRRLFDQYLPFWEKGGYDQQHGGFMCELNDDGSVFNDEKYVWYQGRGIWVYAFLYNHFGKHAHYLDVAARTRDFMVKHMYAGQGKWVEKVDREGKVLEGVGGLVYGWLFAAAGLAQYYIATGDPKDLELTKETIRAAMTAYDDPAYSDTHTTQYTAVEIPAKGVRSQGHSMVLASILVDLLRVHDDPELARLQRRHIELITRRFWNPDYGITNEYLDHDFARIPGAESYMFAGHSLETLWVVLQDALRTKDRRLFDTVAARVRRLLEMCWDYVFEGWGDGDYFVFNTPKHHQGPDYSVKTMWAQCEAMVACLIVLEHTGHAWAKEWYDRVRAFALKTMPVAPHGVWRQAVDRFGKDVKRVGVSEKRKDNFHQARMLMLNLLSLDRMIANQGKLTPFPR
jgi:N-acylglucosamine 2-epimerase